MAPRHPRETILAAIADHQRGEKSPVVCHRYRISERTLYRWLRMASRDAAVPHADPRGVTGPPPGAAKEAVYRTALRVVASALSGEARDRAVDDLGAALRLNREGAELLLCGTAPTGDE